MRTPARQRCSLVLALLAWCAQLWLPVAHAAAMSGQELGVAGWCGTQSAAVQAKLAELPDEVRKIFEKGATDAKHQDCLQFCASAAGGSLPSVAPTIALRAAGLEAERASPVASPSQSQGAPPPARGPPVFS